MPSGSQIDQRPRHGETGLRPFPSFSPSSTLGCSSLAPGSVFILSPVSTAINHYLGDAARLAEQEASPNVLSPFPTLFLLERQKPKQPRSQLCVSLDSLTLISHSHFSAGSSFPQPSCPQEPPRPRRHGGPQLSLPPSACLPRTQYSPPKPKPPARSLLSTVESAGPRKQPCTSGCWSLSGLDTALAFLTDRSPCISSSLWPGWGSSDSCRRGVLVKGHRAWFIILAFLWTFTVPVFHCYQRLRDEGNRFKQHMVRGEQGGRLHESQCPKAWLKRPQLR